MDVQRTVPPVTDDRIPAEVVRSEERLLTGVERVATGRVRFGRRLVTEQRQVTVTLRREEFFLEELPVADSTASSPAGDPPAEVVLVLRAEEPVVQVAARPVERVVVRVERRTGAVQVAEVLRREEIAVEQSDHPYVHHQEETRA